MHVPASLSRVLPRARTLIPEDLRRLARARHSLGGARPVTGLPRFRRVLVVAPHPDDETLGCGGTMALLADRGASVTVMTATDGEATRGSRASPEETARRRRAEAERAAEVAGVTPRFLGLADGRLSEQMGELTAALSSAFAELDPEAVFAPWLLDGTPDHRAVADALGGALSNGGENRQPEVWGYEVWTALIPNRIVDITSVIERKRAALAAHETAALALDLSAGEGLGRWRSMHSLGGRGWAEAFLASSAEQYQALRAEPHYGS
jgi:LmbE family N-acetylglucosaminyl deacetylase